MTSLRCAGSWKATLPPIAADPALLRRALGNLVTNALRHTPSGGMVRVAVSAADPGWQRITVSDTGPGIPPELLPRVFDLFTQGAPVTQGRPGMGLGLTLVKEYVELHGGRVQVRSDGPGRGSEFIVRLPLRQGAPIR